MAAALVLSVPGSVEGAQKCPGKKGYALQQCLRELREQDGKGDARDEFLEPRQYEQPGEVVTLPSGVQYRELLEGTGRTAEIGSVCDVVEVGVVVDGGDGSVDSAGSVAAIRVSAPSSRAKPLSSP